MTPLYTRARLFLGAPWIAYQPVEVGREATELCHALHAERSDALDLRLRRALFRVRVDGEAAKERSAIVAETMRKGPLVAEVRLAVDATLAALARGEDEWAKRYRVAIDRIYGWLPNVTLTAARRDGSLTTGGTMPVDAPRPIPTMQQVRATRRVERVLPRSAFLTCLRCHGAPWAIYAYTNPNGHGAGPDGITRRVECIGCSRGLCCGCDSRDAEVFVSGDKLECDNCGRSWAVPV